MTEVKVFLNKNEGSNIKSNPPLARDDIFLGKFPKGEPGQIEQALLDTLLIPPEPDCSWNPAPTYWSKIRTQPSSVGADQSPATTVIESSSQTRS